jgi:hypothetical protein
MILKGTDEDHTILSPRLTDEAADEQLETIASHVNTGEILRLPWVIAHGINILVAQKIPDSGRARAL